MNLVNLVSEGIGITPTRNFNTLYIILDSIFILALLALLIWKKRYSNVLFSLFGGILYTIVDFGGFYALSHTRTVMINGEVAGVLGTFWVLLWMSMSYGISNFCFMWALLSKDKLRKYWVFLIIMWWMVCPSMAELGGPATIQTSRTTGVYHAWNAVIMVSQYFLITIILLLKRNEKKEFVNILWLCAIGMAVQFGWEFSLLINGIRPLNDKSIQTLIINSFLETNMCMPTTFAVYYFWSKYFKEDLTKVKKEELAVETAAE